MFNSKAEVSHLHLSLSVGGHSWSCLNAIINQHICLSIYISQFLIMFTLSSLLSLLLPLNFSFHLLCYQNKCLFKSHNQVYYDSKTYILYYTYLRKAFGLHRLIRTVSANRGWFSMSRTN